MDGDMHQSQLVVGPPQVIHGLLSVSDRLIRFNQMDAIDVESKYLYDPSNRRVVVEKCKGLGIWAKAVEPKNKSRRQEQAYVEGGGMAIDDAALHDHTEICNTEAQTVGESEEGS
jgi:hypothetical protein